MRRVLRLIPALPLVVLLLGGCREPEAVGYSFSIRDTQAVGLTTIYESQLGVSPTNDDVVDAVFGGLESLDLEGFRSGRYTFSFYKPGSDKHTIFAVDYRIESDPENGFLLVEEFKEKSRPIETNDKKAIAQTFAIAFEGDFVDTLKEIQNKTSLPSPAPPRVPNFHDH